MQPPFHRFEEFISLPPADINLVRGWAANPRRIARHQPIRREGDPVNGVFFLLAGWAASSVILRDGQRQVIKVHVPGDMLGFPSLVLSSAGETLEAITDASVCPISNAAIGRVIEQHPRLTVALLLNAQKERVALTQALTWIGSASALARMAAFLLDLYDRLEAAGLVTDGAFDFPLTQHFIGDLLGLTAVHVNRTLKRLDATGYIDRKKGRMQILDFEGLRSVSPNLPPKPAGHAAWARIGGKS